MRSWFPAKDPLELSLTLRKGIAVGELGIKMIFLITLQILNLLTIIWNVEVHEKP